jgi:hypothetical protein
MHGIESVKVYFTWYWGLKWVSKCIIFDLWPIMALCISAFTAVFEKKYNTDMLKGTDESLLISSVDWDDAVM